jgi:hypothetical protein
MVVRKMLEKIMQSDGHYCSKLENSLDLQIIHDNGNKINIPLAVKTLTSTGATLSIQMMDTVVRDLIQKGQQVFLRMNCGDGGTPVELLGKILWTRNHKDDLALTLGLEMIEPLPPAIRHSLEDHMSINANDMKVLWDNWDEINDREVPAVLSDQSIFKIPAGVGASKDTQENIGKENYLQHWIGFAIILSGIALQLPQIEYLNVFGFFLMFAGSIAIASKSIMSLRPQVPSNRLHE